MTYYILLVWVLLSTPGQPAGYAWSAAGAHTSEAECAAAGKAASPAKYACVLRLPEHGSGSC